jgi:N-methylhydantoinase A/oxoprolinase/acetone carboxylase beta subunit
VLPEIKEYERTSTTVINAYVMPIVASYLRALRSGLDKAGIPGAPAADAIQRRADQRFLRRPSGR